MIEHTTSNYDQVVEVLERKERRKLRRSIYLVAATWFLAGAAVALNPPFVTAGDEPACVALAPATIETSRHYVADWTTLEARP